MTATAQAPEITVDVHGELDCVGVEQVLAETSAHATVLREQVESLEAELAALRRENLRMRAGMDDLRAKEHLMREQRDAAEAQIGIIQAELAATEEAAVPMGTLTFATISQNDVVATYRAVSRITRGPLPPAVTEAVQEATEGIQAAMRSAGEDALLAEVRKIVRRRRRAQSTGRRNTARRQSAAPVRTRARATQSAG